MVIGLALLALGLVIYPLATQADDLYAYRVVFAIGAAMVPVMHSTTLQDTVANKSRGVFTAMGSFCTGHSQHASGMQRIAKGLREVLTDLPASIFSMRFGLVMIEVIHVLAEHERLMELSMTDENISSSLYVSNLVDILVASLQAPVSTETRREMMGSRYRTA